MVIRRTRTLPILLLLLAAGGLRAAPDTPRAKPEVISVVNRADAFAARREQVEPVVRAHGRARDADGRRR